MWYGLEYSNEDDTQSAVFDTITRARTSREDQLLPKKYEDQETSIRRSTETISQKKTRVGVQIRSIPDRIKKIIGTKIVDVSVVPFIRPKTLTINADGLKPNTNVYCFFDGVNVTESCLVGGTGPSAGTFRTGTEGSNAGAIRDLKFTIPAGQYESGEKLFRIIDSENNDVEFATTSAEATYYAQGLKLSRDSGSVSVRPPVLRRQTVSSERVVSNVFSRETVFDSNSNTQYIDPLAQTFTVSSNEYPGGVFLDSVDVWFKSKHATLPITLQIRPTVQGAPHSSIILPFSEVVKYPDDISVNDLSTGPLNSSKFEFKTPVFLEPGEYALCFVTNTGDYELFMGEVGELDIASQQSISSELYVNNLYEPQNGSVALPNATRDLMVQINKCVYNIVPQTCKFNGPALGTTADVDMLYLQAKQLRLTGADIEYDLEVKGASRSSFSQTIDSNQNIKLDEKRSIKNSTDISLDATLFPTTQDVAPMIDVSQSSIIGISNFIDGSAEDDVEQDPSSGGQVGCKTRYITRRVNLLNSSAGSDPNAFQVILDKAGSGTVDVYLKAAAAGDTTPFDEQPYIKLRKITSGVDDDLSESDFKQLRYEAAENQMGARFGDTNGFNVFAVKVCMTTTDTTNPPLVKDLRAVALTRPRS